VQQLARVRPTVLVRVVPQPAILVQIHGRLGYRDRGLARQQHRLQIGAGHVLANGRRACGGRHVGKQPGVDGGLRQRVAGRKGCRVTDAGSQRRQRSAHHRHARHRIADPHVRQRHVSRVGHRERVVQQLARVRPTVLVRVVPQQVIQVPIDSRLDHRNGGLRQAQPCIQRQVRLIGPDRHR